MKSPYNDPHSKKQQKRLMKQRKWIRVAKLRNTPHGVVRVLISRWDEHFIVHVDNLDIELFFHTETDIRTWDKITWKRLVKEFKKSFDEFQAKK